jgi:hypothetical protein
MITAKATKINNFMRHVYMLFNNCNVMPTSTTQECTQLCAQSRKDAKTHCGVCPMALPYDFFSSLHPSLFFFHDPLPYPLNIHTLTSMYALPQDAVFIPLEKIGCYHKRTKVFIIYFCIFNSSAWLCLSKKTTLELYNYVFSSFFFFIAAPNNFHLLYELAYLPVFQFPSPLHQRPRSHGWL